MLCIEDGMLVNITGNPDRVKKWLTNSSGYYLQAFVTKINKATELEVKQTPAYLTQLIGRFHGLDTKLIGLYRSDTDSSVTSVTYKYLVGMGSIVIGKATITIQELNDVRTATLVYQYRVSAPEYRAKNTNMKQRYRKGKPRTFRDNIHRWRKYEGERHR